MHASGDGRLPLGSLLWANVNRPFRVELPSSSRDRERPLFARIAVVHGVGRERPLSRQRCASTPIGFDLVQGGRGARGGLVQVREVWARAVLPASPMVGHKTVVEDRSPPIID